MPRLPANFLLSCGAVLRKLGREESESKMAVFIPPGNWGMVEEELYRSGQPNVLNFPFLEKLDLKTIIYLAPDEPAQQL